MVESQDIDPAFYLETSFPISQMASQMKSLLLLRKPLLFGSVFTGTAIAMAARSAAKPVLADSSSAPAQKTFGNGPAFQSLILESSELVNHNTKRLRFKLPSDTYVSGLGLTSSLLTVAWPKGAWLPVARPYTPVSPLDAPGHIDFLVKQYPKGKMSTHIHDLQPGDKLMFAAALRGHAWQPNSYSHITLIAGGAGITPIYQLAQGILANPEDRTKMTMVVGVNTDQDVLFKEQFARLEKEYPDRFSAVYTVSNPMPGSTYKKGYVTKELLKETVSLPKGQDAKVFVCGPPSMEAALLKTINPENLSSSKHLQLLNSIDKLRSQGIDHYISLPQIIVCGDQSSGKSSVLEAISGVPFPVKSSLCTRFPIELVLRKTAHKGAKVRIIRDQGNSPKTTKRAHQRVEAEFEENLDDYEDLPSLIEGATNAMGLLSSGRAFSEDTLHIEISGPDHPHLTIVDLPGLIHSETKHQSALDIDLIQSVIKKYMGKRRTIILAVVSAKNDFANQIVLKLARMADPNGNRTLGVITKPDTLLPGSNNEASFVSLARNKEIEFRLGWHVLRNMDSDKEQSSLSERDATEKEFFSRGAWANLSESSLGIQKLREKLSDLLFQQIARELPELITEIQEKATACREALQYLGRPRTTLEEQRNYMFEISGHFQTLIKAATDGNYNNSFFGNAETQLGYQKHFRAVIQNLSEDFAQDIEVRGRQYQITSNSNVKERSLDTTFLTREDFIKKIIKLMQRTRGRELPGMFDPMIVTRLFKEQSAPWAEIAMTHVKKVWQAAQTFLEHLVAHVAEKSTVRTIICTIVQPKLDEVLDAMRKKTKELLRPHQDSHPITYNTALIERMPQIRFERKATALTSALKSYFNVSDMEAIYRTVDLNELHQSILTTLVEQNETDYAAARALDYVEAYYEIALNRFIDDISVEVIETCLVEELERIFNPLQIAKMPAGTISSIAGETVASRKVREDLEKKLDILTKGIATCREYASIQVEGSDHDSAEEEEEEKGELKGGNLEADQQPPNGDALEENRTDSPVVTDASMAESAPAPDMEPLEEPEPILEPEEETPTKAPAPRPPPADLNEFWSSFTTKTEKTAILESEEETPIEALDAAPPPAEVDEFLPSSKKAKKKKRKNATLASEPTPEPPSEPFFR
ncbi:NADH-cytochrome b5 reductase 2 [Paramyrothecium foliicola]|nr:NADH-cytochrome b5 reductase 2 [Paramyrothecium foliicola]